MTIANTENLMTKLIEYGPVTLNKPMTKEEFIALSSRFPGLQMEREANGKTTIMSPVKSGSGKRESILDYFIRHWKCKTGLGEVYGSATGIELPDGAIKSPGCAWVSDERLATAPKLTEEDFLQVVPDFIAEIRFHSDRIATLKKKMTPPGWQTVSGWAG